MSKNTIFETVQTFLKKVLRAPGNKAKLGEESLPKAKDYRAVAPAYVPLLVATLALDFTIISLSLAQH